MRSDRPQESKLLPFVRINNSSTDRSRNKKIAIERRIILALIYPTQIPYSDRDPATLPVSPSTLPARLF